MHIFVYLLPCTVLYDLYKRSCLTVFIYTVFIRMICRSTLEYEEESNVVSESPVVQLGCCK